MPKRTKGDVLGEAEAESLAAAAPAKRERKRVASTPQELVEAPPAKAGERGEPTAQKRGRRAAEGVAADGTHEQPGKNKEGEPERKKRAAEDADREDADAAESAGKVDWAARKKEKAKRRQERAAGLDEAAKAAAGEKSQELASRMAKNEALRKKGKMTKKEKYLAAKAAKKEQARGQPAGSAAGGREAKPFDLKAALAAAGVDALDPRATSCFLMGLPYSATEKHVSAHFAAVGPCTVQLLQDPGASRPNGTGFATFKIAEHALEACSLTGSTIQGRWIKVRLCEPRGNGRGACEPGEKPDGCLSVIVKYDRSITEASLWKFFQGCGVSNISCLADKGTGEPRGVAFLDFEDTADVDRAIEKNSQSIKGLPISVRYKKELPGAETQASSRGRGVAPHNKAPPVPPPAGTATRLDSSSDSDDE